MSERLRELYPHIRRGLSWKSVRRYCVANGLRTARRRAIVTDEELDESVARALTKVCMIFWQYTCASTDFETLGFWVGWSTLQTRKDAQRHSRCWSASRSKACWQIPETGESGASRKTTSEY